MQINVIRFFYSFIVSDESADEDEDSIEDSEFDDDEDEEEDDEDEEEEDEEDKDVEKDQNAYGDKKYDKESDKNCTPDFKNRLYEAKQEEDEDKQGSSDYEVVDFDRFRLLMINSIPNQIYIFLLTARMIMNSIKLVGHLLTVHQDRDCPHQLMQKNRGKTQVITYIFKALFTTSIEKSCCMKQNKNVIDLTLGFLNRRSIKQESTEVDSSSGNCFLLMSSDSEDEDVFLDEKKSKSSYISIKFFLLFFFI